MIKLITGAKGTGKTKIIIDLANDEIANAKGDVVFVTDTDKYLHSVSYKIRLINAEGLKRNDDISEDSLLGFILGILEGNYDIETLYIDGILRMLKKKVGELEDFFITLEKVAQDTNTNLVLTISENEENFPDFLKKYLN